MKIKNYYLSNISYRLKEEIDYEQNNLNILLKIKNPSSIIILEIKQTIHTIIRINNKLHEKYNRTICGSMFGFVQVGHRINKLQKLTKDE